MTRWRHDLSVGAWVAPQSTVVEAKDPPCGGRELPLDLFRELQRVVFIRGPKNVSGTRAKRFHEAQKDAHSQTGTVRAAAIDGMQRGKRTISGLRVHGTQEGTAECFVRRPWLVTPWGWEARGFYRLPQRRAQEPHTQDTIRHGCLSNAYPVQSQICTQCNRTP